MAAAATILHGELPCPPSLRQSLTPCVCMQAISGRNRAAVKSVTNQREVCPDYGGFQDCEGREQWKSYHPCSLLWPPFSGLTKLHPRVLGRSSIYSGKYNICVVKNKLFTADILSQAKQMKIIMQYGVGLEGVDIDAAMRLGIKVARIPGDLTGNAASCAEMAIYLMLGLLRKQTEMAVAVKQKKLGEPVGETLLGKTVLLLGYGNIGIDLAKRLRPFGVKIIATKRGWSLKNGGSSKTDASGTNHEMVDEKGGHDEIYELANKADIVVCCLSLNKETAGIVNEQFISSMKKGSLLVNIARGGLLDYEAVKRNLESGQLGGLGMDVAWTEPFNPDDPILKFRNVILTPHVAGVTEHSYRSMSKVVGDVALQLHTGAPFTVIEFVN
ncbi:hypothetical protein SAY87_004832 [Trapa incisa]|uniref:Phosphoglycerate dehydrogenase n=1 Tax=Trapa incisa TaxID=236973 RepID=A0AAN7JPF7_9MYRT|nr:hypothetical protein SAY87_004832 [Trapa incisa]